MSKFVQRFVVRACPSPDHPEYFTWQTARLCLFVGGDNREQSLAVAHEELKRRGWLPIGSFRKETLIEQRICNVAPDAVKKAYFLAKAGTVFFGHEFDQMPITTKLSPSFLKAPRIGETFIDLVMVRAGGHRLTAAEIEKVGGLNVDYVISRVALELKNLQQEGLLVSSRQDRLAQLLSSVCSGPEYVSLSPSDLSDNEWLTYLDIVGGPIQTHIKKAAKQIKRSRESLNCEKGAVILLNTGYNSIPHSLFDELVNHYSAKDTKQIDIVLCISSWLVTNGFESEVHFAFTPDEGGCEVVTAIRDSFWTGIGELMTLWAREGFLQTGEMLDPSEPIAFSKGGVNYSTEPVTLPSELDQSWRKTLR